jgi:hypothetical protein
MMKRLAILAIVVAPLVAAACGGGQPEAAAPANAASASAPAASAAASAPAAAASSAAPAESSAAGPVAGASAPPAEEAIPGAPQEGEWDKWSHDQKLAYMKNTVMPKLGAEFHDFDAKKFAEPRCTLCHGSSAKKGNFKMPNAELPKLDITPDGFKALKEKKPEMVDFMIKKVEHDTARLIGEKPFDPQTKSGFGCLNCHTAKK